MLTCLNLCLTSWCRRLLLLWARSAAVVPAPHDIIFLNKLQASVYCVLGNLILNGVTMLCTACVAWISQNCSSNSQISSKNCIENLLLIAGSYAFSRAFFLVNRRRRWKETTRHTTTWRILPSSLMTLWSRSSGNFLWVTTDWRGSHLEDEVLHNSSLLYVLSEE